MVSLIFLLLCLGFTPLDRSLLDARCHFAEVFDANLFDSFGQGLRQIPHSVKDILVACTAGMMHILQCQSMVLKTNFMSSLHTQSSTSQTRIKVTKEVDLGAFFQS